MKSEHRHELETNVLSKELATWVERIKPHTTAITIGIGVLVGLYLAATWWSSSRADRDRQFWEEFHLKLSSASDPELKQILRLADNDEYAGAPGQEWAYATWADRQLRLATQDYLVNREQALERLDDVVGVYTTLAEGAASEEVANRARFGLARVYELQNKIDQARRQYNMVRGPLAELAEQRAERLGDESVQQIAGWLAEADLPRPPAVDNDGLGQPPEFGVKRPVPSSGGSGSGSSEPLQRTLDEILGDLTAAEEDEDRYAGASADDAEADETSDDSSDDQPPAADEADADAPDNASAEDEPSAP